MGCVAVVVVGGAAKDIGKTALVCAVIAALPEFEWTAVKVTGHDYEHGGGSGPAGKQVICEEREEGPGTDTARYLAAGARRALLVMRYGTDVPRSEIRAALSSDRNVIFESNRIVDAVRPDLCLALVGEASGEMKPSFSRLLRVADALVSVGAVRVQNVDAPAGLRRFSLVGVERLSAEMVAWMRERLGQSSQTNPFE